MSTLALLTILLGVFIIAIRAPLIVAPTWTVGWYRWLLGTITRIRVLGGVMVVLGVAIARLARDVDSPEARIIGFIGALIGAVVFLMLLLVPVAYQRMALTMLDVMQNPVLLRCIGVLGTAFGVLMLYLARAVA